MRVLILGAGQVGTTVAEALVAEDNDITIVDHDSTTLKRLADRLDVRTVTGNAAYPSVLREAGIEDTDLLIAVTQSDQTNLVACKIARTSFSVPTRIARLRSADFADARLLSTENFAVDYAICPEQEITEQIARLIEIPEALQVVEFADGKVTLVGVRAHPDGALVNLPISAIREHLPPGIDARVAAIFREHRPLEPDGRTVIQPGDEVFVLAASGHIRLVLKELHRALKPVRRVMIAGGGNIGGRVARRLEARYEVKVVERDRERAETIASELGRTIVLLGEATDEDLLGRENIDEVDMFLALTNDDEDNIMAASLAKRLGCRRVLALINRRAYADMIQGGPVDIGLSPAQASIGPLLSHVRRGDVARVHSLRRGAAEALELVANGDARTSQVVGRRLEELPRIKGAHIGAIVRRGEVPQVIQQGGFLVEALIDQIIIPHHDTTIESGDHVIIFCIGKKSIARVEKLFQVSPEYL